jgi:hypothetical protein
MPSSNAKPVRRGSTEDPSTRLSLRLVKKDGKGRCAGPLPAAGAFCCAELLKRVLAVDGWACPSCGERMRLRAVVDGGGTPTRILTGLLRARGPPDQPLDGEGRGAYAGA